MAIKWTPVKYGFTNARIGAFSIAAGWDHGAYIAEIRDLGIRVADLPSLEAAKTRAEAELRKALTAALRAMGDEAAPKGGG